MHALKTLTPGKPIVVIGAVIREHGTSRKGTRGHFCEEKFPEGGKIEICQ